MSRGLRDELARQEAYLQTLPRDFTFPLFNARRALESQRRSGYRHTAAAARELVDNAIEAGADTVHVVFDTERNEQGRQLVTAVAVIDNGAGMLPLMARCALTWGGGTHFDDPRFIGKFGFGLPNASINQTKHTEVYTRTDPSHAFSKAWLDVSEFAQHGIQVIPEPIFADPPLFVQRYLAQAGIGLDHGTVVVWKIPDRLSYKTAKALREHLLDDFGVTYRYLLSQPRPGTGRLLTIVVDGELVQVVDPLFLLPNGRYFVPAEEGGAQLIEDRRLYVRYVTDRSSGERLLLKLERLADVETPDVILLAHGTMRIRIVRFLPGFVQEKEQDGVRSDAWRRFEIRKSRRGMAFVRAGREIDTVDALPRSARDRAAGLGHWPLLQSYAYHWGIEVHFTPALDEVFGITNDKQGVRPIEDFWRLLAAEGIDDAARSENRWQEQHRQRVPRAETSLLATPAERAATLTDVATSATVNGVVDREAAALRLQDEARARAEITAESLDEARQVLEEEAQYRRYRIAYYEAEDGPFYKPEWVGSQLVVRVNRLHPFYQTLYGDLLLAPGNERAKEAVDLLLMALGRGELFAPNEQIAAFYAGQRKMQWSPWLAVAMETLGQHLPADDDMGAH